VLAAAHELQLDLVLDFLDVDRAAFGLRLTNAATTPSVSTSPARARAPTQRPGRR
jgi:hypothetical protein